MCRDWFDRLLLILALAYWILLAVALMAKQRSDICLGRGAAVIARERAVCFSLGDR
jgi:hypothetical protein